LNRNGSTTITIRQLRDRGEQGFAMVTMLLVMLIVSALVVVMLATQNHTANTTARNRSWGAAIHVAESGVHQAIAYLQSTNGVAPAGVQTGTTAEGTWEYRVTAMPRNHYQIDAVGTVGNVASLAASRRIRVILAPPTSFRYALFSLSDVTTKNNNVVCGDVWANTNVTVYANDAVRKADAADCPAGTAGGGNVTAATGWISMQQGSVADGDLWSGGYDSTGTAVTIANKGAIGGKVKASSSTPGCADDSLHARYSVANDGVVTGSITSWGAISGSGSSGTRSPQTCTTAPASEKMPTFNWSAANYPAATLHTYTFPADYSLFNAYLAANRTGLQGTFYIEGGSAATPIDLTGVSIVGDTTIVATGSPIDASGGIGAANTADKILTLVSYYAAPASSCTTTGGNPGDCAIGFKNDFDMSGTALSGGSNTAVLLFAPNGPIAFKNNAQFNGAVYGNNIQVKNNMSMAYDPRIDQIVGFGDVTLDINAWMECSPGSVTTATC
jgi:competence protein ComGC